MSRLGTQILFVLIGIAWVSFVCFDLFVHTFGDCGDDHMCAIYKQAAGGLVLWRGLCVTIIIFIAYRFFRKDSDV